MSASTGFTGISIEAGKLHDFDVTEFVRLEASVESYNEARLTKHSESDAPRLSNRFIRRAGWMIMVDFVRFVDYDEPSSSWAHLIGGNPDRQLDDDDVAARARVFARIAEVGKQEVEPGGVAQFM